MSGRSWRRRAAIEVHGTLWGIETQYPITAGGLFKDTLFKRDYRSKTEGPLPGPFRAVLSCNLCSGVLRRAVLVGVVLASFFAVMRRVQRMAVRNVSVMSGALVVTGFMVSSGFAVMFGCSFMVMGSLMMMIGAFVCHGYVSW
jgi:hypothetical protein